LLLRRAVISSVLLLGACGHGGSGPSPLVFIPSPSFGAPAVAQKITAGITPNAGFAQAALGSDQRIWFTEFNANNLAAVTPTGAVTAYGMPAAMHPKGITAGADGNMWAGGNGQIVRVAVNGAFTAFPIAGARIAALAVGPDGNVWFADGGNDTVGMITHDGAILAYPMPLGASPSGIAAGIDGNLWVADTNGSILRVTTSGFFTQFTAGISAGGSPQQIVSGSDGRLYFTEPFFSATRGDRIGRISLSGDITELGNLAPNASPDGITTGKDGNLYFSEFGESNIGRVSVPSGAVSQIPLDVAHGSAIVNGPDGNLWVGGIQTIYKILY